MDSVQQDSGSPDPLPDMLARLDTVRTSLQHQVAIGFLDSFLAQEQLDQVPAIDAYGGQWTPQMDGTWTLVTADGQERPGADPRQFVEATAAWLVAAPETRRDDGPRGAPSVWDAAPAGTTASAEGAPPVRPASARGQLLSRLRPAPTVAPEGEQRRAVPWLAIATVAGIIAIAAAAVVLVTGHEPAPPASDPSPSAPSSIAAPAPQPLILPAGVPDPSRFGLARSPADTGSPGQALYQLDPAGRRSMCARAAAWLAQAQPGTSAPRLKKSCQAQAADAAGWVTAIGTDRTLTIAVRLAPQPLLTLTWDPDPR